MKKYIYTATVLILGIAFLVWNPIKSKTQVVSEPIKFPQFEHGDIVLKRGKGIVSKKMISALGEEVPYSHLGIYYQKADTAFLIHSLSGGDNQQDGVQAISINDFVGSAKPDAVLFVRRKASVEMRNKFAEEAFNLAEKKVGFDLDFDMRDSNRIYCTELAYWSFKKAGDSLEFKTKNIGGVPVILFETLRNEDYFEILK